jgi:phenylalanyl-tRNA synthetase alpha chain
MIEEIIKRAEEFFEEGKREISGIDDVELLEKWKIKFLGRKSYLNQIFSVISTLTKEEKVICGKKLNEIKQKLMELCKKERNKI